MSSILIALVVASFGLSQTDGITNGENASTTQQETPDRLEAMAKIGIERVLSRILNAPIEVGAVSIVPKQEFMLLKSVRVGNPPGFDGDTALAAEEIRVDADIRSLFSRKPTIRLIEVKEASVNAETKLPAGSNIMRLMNNAKQFKSGPLAERAQKEWLIEKAVLEGAKVVSDTRLIHERRDERTLGTIEMAFKGPDGGGLPAEEAVAQFLSKLVSELNIVPDETPAGKAVELFNLLKKR